MENNIKYRIERFERSIAVSDFLKDYVDVAKFLKFCKECENYNNVWSCPKYDFDPMDIWNKYDMLDLILLKLVYDDEVLGRRYSKEELKNIQLKTILPEKHRLMDECLKREKSTAGTLALSAGSCDICNTSRGEKNCARTSNQPCRHPDKMRYSVESLGGDVVRLSEEIFGINLKWSKDSAMPEYLSLVCGVLRQSHIFQSY